MKILITGGAGFIGSNFTHYIYNNYDYEITVLDKLTYAGNKANLKEILGEIQFIKGDIGNEDDVKIAMKDCDLVVNFAAETHVDRSIEDPSIFVKTDVLGTYNLLEYARKYDVEKYLQISTDEVYGSIDNGSFTENSNIDPSSPYSASKAGADVLVKAYYKTYDIPVLITRSSNNFGPYQYPEKLIPLFIMNAMNDKSLPVYGDGQNIRDWIYVLDNSHGIDVVLNKGKLGEVYNIGDDRLGHDRRYSLDSSKIRELGWKPEWSFEDAMRETIEWYIANKEFINKLTLN
jgi:dTDP-glucose 4,6-dehydratase